MNRKDLYQSFEAVDDEILERSEKAADIRRKSGWLKWAAMAAGICLLVMGMLGWLELVPSGTQSIGVTESENGVTIPPLEVSLSKSDAESADMIGFFIYQGRCYVYYDRIYKDVDLIDEYLGTATGMIDEWTPRDGYVEFAGSVRGDFYSVKGYDPSFMLCMREANGAIAAYICNTGITLKYGSELYEDRLHLSENWLSVQYESRDSWYQGLGEIYEMDKSDAAIGNFIEGLNNSEFLPCTSVPLTDGQKSIVDLEQYHLYFQMSNGTTVHLRLHEHGYIRFQGILDVCVKIPEEDYNAFVELLDKRTGTPAAAVLDSMGTTLEDCINDPELGAYVPTYVADDVLLEGAGIYYYLDSGTGDKVGTKEIYLYYVDQTDSRRYYAVTVTWAKEYGNNGWAGPMIDSSEINEESITEYMNTDLTSGEALSYSSKFDLGFWYDNVSVVISARNVEVETILSIMESVK